MERIAGNHLAEARAGICSSPQRLAGFLKECLAILAQLRAAAIRHRDIRLDNILVRDGHPVLIDFGWAETKDQPCFTPGNLGGLERIIPGPPCDIYSMGKVFQQIVPRDSQVFAPLLQKMLTPDLARSLPIRYLDRVLSSLELPPAWDVPMVFPILRHAEIATELTPSKDRRFWQRCQAFYNKVFQSERIKE
jgi:serine/threonine protein kinase